MVDGLVLDNGLAERALDALESKASATSVPLAHQCLRAVVMQNMAARQTNGGRGAQGLRPANRTPLVRIWEFRDARRRWHGLLRQL